MRAVVQRVLESEVKIDGESVGKIGKGFLVLLGITHEKALLLHQQELLHFLRLFHEAKIHLLI